MPEHFGHKMLRLTFTNFEYPDRLLGHGTWQMRRELGQVIVGEVTTERRTFSDRIPSEHCAPEESHPRAKWGLLRRDLSSEVCRD
jgi:hypothetical protein